MNERIRENEIKLDILVSLARSQQALAAILESTARTLEVVESNETAQEFIKQAELLSRYQHILAEKIMNTKVRDVRRSEASSPPWINKALACSG